MAPTEEAPVRREVLRMQLRQRVVGVRQPDRDERPVHEEHREVPAERRVRPVHVARRDEQVEHMSKILEEILLAAKFNRGDTGQIEESKEDRRPQQTFFEVFTM